MHGCGPSSYPNTCQKHDFKFLFQIPLMEEITSASSIYPRHTKTFSLMVSFTFTFTSSFCTLCSCPSRSLHTSYPRRKMFATRIENIDFSWLLSHGAPPDRSKCWREILDFAKKCILQYEDFKDAEKNEALNSISSLETRVTAKDAGKRIELSIVTFTESNY